MVVQLGTPKAKNDSGIAAVMDFQFQLGIGSQNKRDSKTNEQNKRDRSNIGSMGNS